MLMADLANPVYLNERVDELRPVDQASFFGQGSDHVPYGGRSRSMSRPTPEALVCDHTLSEQAGRATFAPFGVPVV